MEFLESKHNAATKFQEDKNVSLDITGEELCNNGKQTRHDAHVTHNRWFPALCR